MHYGADVPTGTHRAGIYAPLGHAVSGLLAEVFLPSTSELPSKKRQRKKRGPNWGLQEILALIAVKREEFLERLQVTDAQELFNPETTQWQHVSMSVM
jgi:hypothetical protein